MAIQSLDNIINAVTVGKSQKSIFQKATVNGATSAAGRYHELFTANGIPVAGAFSGTAGTAVQMTASTTGALPLGTDAVSPDNRHLLNMNVFTPTATGVPSKLILCDFLLYYPSLVVTGTPTTLTNGVALPRYTNGKGVMGIVAVQSALGAASPSLTFTYTRADTGGTDTGRVATAITSPVNSAPISTMFQDLGAPFIRLQAGDTGIESVQSYTIGSGTTGTVALILVKPLAVIPTFVINTIVERDYLAQIPSLPKIEDNACLGFIMLTGAAMVINCSFQGELDMIWG